jgi:hypothetical protein
MNLANKWPSLPLLLLLGGRGNMEDPKERYTKTTELFSSKIRTVKNMHFKNFSQGKFSTAGLSLSQNPSFAFSGVLEVLRCWLILGERSLGSLD